MAEIRDAEDRDHALVAIKSFKRDYQAKWPKAVAKIIDDTEVRLVVLRLPGRALDPSQDDKPDRVDLRHGPAAHQGDQGSRLEIGGSGHGLQADRGRQDRWRSVNAPHLVVLVRAGVVFEKGVMVERPSEDDTEVAA